MSIRIRARFMKYKGKVTLGGFGWMYFCFCFFVCEGPADLEKQSKKVDTALQIPSMPNRHGGGKQIQICKRVHHHRISTQMHRNPPQVQQGSGGRTATAMQMHTNWKQMPPFSQNDLPARSRPGLVLNNMLQPNTLALSRA